MKNITYGFPFNLFISNTAHKYYTYTQVQSGSCKYKTGPCKILVFCADVTNSSVSIDAGVFIWWPCFNFINAGTQGHGGQFVGSSVVSPIVWSHLNLFVAVKGGGYSKTIHLTPIVSTENPPHSCTHNPRTPLTAIIRARVKFTGFSVTNAWR